MRRAPIEAMIGHDLDRELVAGVPHFKPGQHSARRVQHAEDAELEVYELAWVNSFGLALLFTVAYDAGEWVALFGFFGGQTTVKEQAVAERVTSPKLVAVLDAARAVSSPRSDTGS